MQVILWNICNWIQFKKKLYKDQNRYLFDPRRPSVRFTLMHCNLLLVTEHTIVNIASGGKAVFIDIIDGADLPILQEVFGAESSTKRWSRTCIDHAILHTWTGRQWASWQVESLTEKRIFFVPASSGVYAISTHLSFLSIERIVIRAGDAGDSSCRIAC